MIAIISDIHGNYPALQAVLQDIDAIGLPNVISLGDVAGYYCRINECIETLRERRILNLMGNHDQYLLQGTGCPRSRSATVCLEYQSKIITPANRQWLAKSPLRQEREELSMVHAGWNDPLDEYLYDLDEMYFATRPERFFFSGHTHIQMIRRFPGRTYCNPGSVGQPRDGDPTAAYAIWADGEITLRRVPYDIEAIAASMERAGFSSYFYQNLYVGARIGDAVEGRRTPASAGGRTEDEHGH